MKRPTDLDAALQLLASRAPTHRTHATLGTTAERKQEPKLDPGPTELVPASPGNGPPGEETADVAVLVALPTPELDSVLKAFGTAWQQEGRDGVI